MKNVYKDLGVERVLLVEDDPWSRDSLSMFFRIVECRMRSVSSGGEAVAAASEERYDLILCDHQVAGENGCSLLKSLCDLQPGAVKILLTSYPAEKVAGNPASAGIDAVIRKPFTVEMLETTLQRILPRNGGGFHETTGRG